MIQVNKVVGHRAALIVALLLVGSLVAPLSLSRVASADDLSVTGTASATIIDATQTVDFTCDPTGGSESGYTFYWNFGDGIGESADQNPSYTFPSAGAFYVTVTVTDDLAATAYWSVDITVNELPSATGTPASATIDAGQNVDFTCTPSGGTGSYYFYWDFGDGVGTSTDQNPSYTFPSAGMFYVTVTVTDDLGGSSGPQDIGTITVNPSLSVTGSASATAIDVTQIVDFTCTPSDGTPPYTYSWSFGDGGSSTDQYPSYEYDSIGTWTAEVTVTDDVGETGYWSVEIKVYDIHDPIVILSNDDFTYDNGVVSGSGTIDEPYIIENWDIDASGAIGIDIEGTDAYFIVRNCYIHDGAGLGYVGIYLLGCVNGILSYNTCTGNDYDTDNYDSVGIYLGSSDGIAVSDNTCTAGNDFGIYLYDSDGNTISGNDCDSDNLCGIYLESSSSNALTDNLCSNDQYGIYLTIDADPSDLNTVSGNTCQNNYVGIFLEWTGDNTLTDNDCSNSYEGIALLLSDGNTIANNTCISDSDSGIYLEGSSGNTISGNDCSEDTYGIGLTYSEEYDDDLEEYVYVYSDSNVLVDNICSYDGAGIYLESVSDNTLSNNTCSNNGDGIFLYYSDGNTIVNNTCELNVGDYSGIYLESSNGNIVTDNTCTYNYDGIYLYDSSGNTISRNNCSSNDDSGMYLEYTGGNVLSDNNCSDNYYYGLCFDSSSGNTVSGNDCSSNDDSGIYIGSSSGNTLSNNTCNSNYNYGTCLYSSNDNVLSGNNCSYNGRGIYLSSSSSNTMSDNICSNNDDGIYLYYSDGNALINNTCNWNYGSGGPECGIYLDSSSGNTLSDNNCSDNDHGIYLSSSNSNILSDNNCSSNDNDGIYLVSSGSNEMTRNQLCDNAQYGIYVDSGSGSNAIWRNTFTDNNGKGVQAYDDGTDNLWYSPGVPHGYGNWWSDWQTPDVAWPGGIVDNPYAIDGSAYAFDEFPLTTAKYISHAPIFINGNSQFTNASGVVWGSGTIDDPYIIEGWDIDASSMHGIRIWNTDAYFIVSDCYVHDGGSSYNGIYLYNCVNGILSDNDCSHNQYGIWIRSSNSNTLNNNICNYETLYGICLYSSSDNYLNNNTANYDNCGINLYSSSSGNHLNNNTCNYETWYGIYLYSSGNTLNNNTCSHSQYGIVLRSSDSNTLSHNNCSSNVQSGMYLYMSGSNNLNNNTCTADRYGIYLEVSSGNAISNNNCSSNVQSGMYLYSSGSNTMNDNTLRYNTRYGLQINSGSGNRIWNNTFTGNNGAGSVRDPAHLQAYDAGASNHWNATGYGNYWSDWTTPDNNHDEIVDTPYVLAGTSGARDEYPLANPLE